MASWDTFDITDMNGLFCYKQDFNEDILRWNVSNVVRMGYVFQFATSFNGDLSQWEVGQVESMRCMFRYATSFTRQLGGAWSTSTARTASMFCNSPGAGAGKTKRADGTIAWMREWCRQRRTVDIKGATCTSRYCTMYRCMFSTVKGSYAQLSVSPCVKFHFQPI